jgi:hypothetical protein
VHSHIIQCAELRTHNVTFHQISNGVLHDAGVCVIKLNDSRCIADAAIHGISCSQEIVLPLSTPIKGVDGSNIDTVLLPKDSTIIISIVGVNRDQDIWGIDAGEWKPERWLAPLPVSVAQIPSVYANLLVILFLFHDL